MIERPTERAKEVWRGGRGGGLRCVVRCVAVCCVALCCVALCRVVCCVALPCVALRCPALPCLVSPCVALRWGALGSGALLCCLHVRSRSLEVEVEVGVSPRGRGRGWCLTARSRSRLSRPGGLLGQWRPAVVVDDVAHWSDWTSARQNRLRREVALGGAVDQSHTQRSAPALGRIGELEYASTEMGHCARGSRFPFSSSRASFDGFHKVPVLVLVRGPAPRWWVAVHIIHCIIKCTVQRFAVQKFAPSNAVAVPGVQSCVLHLRWPRRRLERLHSTPGYQKARHKREEHNLHLAATCHTRFKFPSPH